MYEKKKTVAIQAEAGATNDAINKWSTMDPGQMLTPSRLNGMITCMHMCT